MARQVDMELKKAFAELQEKAMVTSQKLRFADVQIENLKRQKIIAAITEKEVEALDSEIQTYESVGRMFVLTPVEDVKGNLKKRQDAAEDKIKELVANKEYLERNLKDSENNLREMIHQIQSRS